MNDQNPIETRFFRESDENRTGLVHIHDGFVKRCDFGFNAPLERPGNQPAYVVLDDARVLSLHHNQLVSAEDVQAYHSGQRVSRAETVSHLALIGSDPWRADEPVRRVSFFCPDADHLRFWIEFSDGCPLDRIRQTSSERMLTAGRWFERLPDAGERKALPPEAIDALVDAAVAVAQDKGPTIERERRTAQHPARPEV